MLETSGAIYPTTWLNVPEELNLHQNIYMPALFLASTKYFLVPENIT
jgi:hypothetical protein